HLSRKYYSHHRSWTDDGDCEFHNHRDRLLRWGAHAGLHDWPHGYYLAAPIPGGDHRRYLQRYQFRRTNCDVQLHGFGDVAQPLHPGRQHSRYAAVQLDDRAVRVHAMRDRVHADWNRCSDHQGVNYYSSTHGA